MELTKNERETLLLAIGTATDKETQVIEKLKGEVRHVGITAAIVERTKYLAALDRLKKKLTRSIDARPSVC
jgi:bifunctional DNase/RNase